MTEEKQVSAVDRIAMDVFGSPYKQLSSEQRLQVYGLAQQHQLIHAAMTSVANMQAINNNMLLIFEILTQPQSKILM